MFRVFSILLVLFCCSAAMASISKVNDARLWNAPDHSRLVLDLSKPVDHSVLVLPNPDRLVLDIKNAQKRADFSSLDLGQSPIKGIRSAPRNKNDLRIVLDLRGKASPKSFLLKANEQYGDRLVVDLYPENNAQQVNKKVTKTRSGEKKEVVIVIDPGHGGEDPGAMGPNRLREKDVVLAISKKLAHVINQQTGFRAELTRSSDYYVGLRDRKRIARKHNADLLVSVHADAFINDKANGASVYALSTRGATSETAKWLAKKENSADLIGGVGGVSLNDKDDLLAGVLLDLSSTASLKASLTVGENVLSSMRGISRLHKKDVQQAAFVVLKSPDIPSILVETGFISNPKESSRLKTKHYQQKIAKAIGNGISKYFEKNPVENVVAFSTPPASNQYQASASTARKYTVRKGDTLSHIAMKNDVSVKTLRQLNGLRGDTVWVGQKLKLPAS